MFFVVVFATGTSAWAVVKMAGISLLLLFFFYPIILGLVGILIVTLPGIVSFLNDKLYQGSLVAAIIHSLVGVAAFLSYYTLHIFEPDSPNVLELLTLLLSHQWDTAPFKTIIMFPVYVLVLFTPLGVASMPVVLSKIRKN